MHHDQVTPESIRKMVDMLIKEADEMGPALLGRFDSRPHAVYSHYREALSQIVGPDSQFPYLRTEADLSQVIQELQAAMRFC